MNTIEKFVKTTENNRISFEFEGNRNMVGVLLLLRNFEEYSDQVIDVSYAQNGIFTNPKEFGKIQVGHTSKAQIFLETPVAVSHLFITLPDENLIVRDIEVYEIPEDNSNQYPTYFDTDLKENYYIDSVSIFTAPEGYSHYSVYTSMNGRDFELLAKKQDDKPCDMNKGDTYDAKGREARIIRTYIEYNSSSTTALFDKVEFTGKKSGTAVQRRPKIEIADFCDSEYNVEITDKDTYDEVYGILDRRVGEQYRSWFEFELASNPNGKDYDYFEISSKDNKILIKANNGVSLATGLNHYLKYYCKVNICQVGDQVKMPQVPVALENNVFKETKAKVRYAYNYCTLSYSMAFMGENEWQEELDWLALNGVNVVLDATAQEEVWRRFLTDIGYTHEEILKYIAGPAYYAWAYMANLTGFGGPVHDSWFISRTELARKNQLRMRKLGMKPVLQGYSGMVPNDIAEHIKDIDYIPQGTWCSFERPAMLRTTSPVFKEFAKKFYKAQAEVYGDYSNFYATDPFHEGGIVADMSLRDVSKEVLSAMLSHDSNAVWVIQSWQSNPSSALLEGLGDVNNGKAHALILDLSADVDPNYNKGYAGNFNHGNSAEFDATPWVFCMLNNFGGRLGIYGHIDNLAKWIPEVFNDCKCVAGIGIAPEASFNNPVLYDFLFETVWVENADATMQEINLVDWIGHYSERRYGAKSSSAKEAWEILLNTVYKAELSPFGGAPESIVNTRPNLVCLPASSWGNIKISYDKAEIKKVARLLLSDYEQLKESAGYRYDLITVYQQILSNTAQDVHADMVAAYKNNDLKEFERISDEFLKIADLMDKVAGCCKYYMLGRWVEQAKALVNDTDDFTKMIFELNAKSIITTWGSYNQSETGGLHDYSNRQWSGIISDFYKQRWIRWINERKNELSGHPFEEKIDWFAWEWKWARQNDCYPTTPNDFNLKDFADEVIN